MPNPNPTLRGIRKHRKKIIDAKAKRLANNKPKWKDEKYMNLKQLDEYLDSYLELEDEMLRPTNKQAHVALVLYCNKSKTDNSTNTLEKEDDALKILLQNAERDNKE